MVICQFRQVISTWLPMRATTAASSAYDRAPLHLESALPMLRKQQALGNSARLRPKTSSGKLSERPRCGEVGGSLFATATCRQPERPATAAERVGDRRSSAPDIMRSAESGGIGALCAIPLSASDQAKERLWTAPEGGFGQRRGATGLRGNSSGVGQGSTLSNAWGTAILPQSGVGGGCSTR